MNDVEMVCRAMCSNPDWKCADGRAVWEHHIPKAEKLLKRLERRKIGLKPGLRARGSEYNKGYQSGFRTGQRGNGAYSEGRKQGRYDIKYGVKRFFHDGVKVVWLEKLMKGKVHV